MIRLLTALLLTTGVALAQETTDGTPAIRLGSEGLGAATPTPEATAAPADVDENAPRYAVVIQTDSGAQAEVWVNYQRAGIAPVRAMVVEGVHNIAVLSEGITPVHIPITVTSRDDTVTVKIPMEPVTQDNHQSILQHLNALASQRPNDPTLRLAAAQLVVKESEAIQLLAMVDRSAPGSPLSALLRARWLQAGGKREESLALIEGALQAEPNFAALHRQHARIHAVMDKDQLAFEAANKAVQLDPVDWQNFYVRGIVYRELGKKTEALQDLNKALELSPENGSVTRAIKGLSEG